VTDRYIKYVITTDNAGAITGMRQVEEGATTLGSKLETTGSKLKSLGSGMTSFGHKLTALSVPLLAVGGYSVKMAVDFQSSMTQLQTQAGASGKELKYLEGQVLKLGPKVAEGPKELAEALYPIRSVGLKGSEAMKALAAASKGAQISGAGLTETADAMAGAMRTGIKEIHSASGAMGIMNGIVGLGKMHLSELTAAMGTGLLSEAKKAGLGFRDVGAAIDAMTRQGIPADAEATRLRTNLTKMAAPTGVALRALKSIGLEQFSLANAMKSPGGLVTALDLLHGHLSKIGSDEQALVLSKAFGGAKGSANVAGLLNALPEMTKIQGQLAKTGEGQFEKAFGERTRDASFKMQAALAAGKTALVSFGQTLIPIVIPALTKFSKLVIDGIEWLKRLPKPLKDVMIGFTVLLAVGGPLLIFFGNMISAVGSVYTGLGKMLPVLAQLGPTVAATDTELGSAGLLGTLGSMAGGFVALATSIALPIAALTSVIYLLDEIKHKGIKGVINEASSLNPFSPTVTAAGMSEQKERESLRHAYGAHVPYGVVNPSLMGATQESPAQRAASARFAQEVAAHIVGSQSLVQSTSVYLDGKEIGRSVGKHARNDPTIAKPLAEAITKYAQQRSPVARATP
jgi:TP901 family phage tail tape measure protein